jgi:hypothetical protein
LADESTEIRRTNAVPSAGVNWDSFSSIGGSKKRQLPLFEGIWRMPDEEAKADQFG